MTKFYIEATQNLPDHDRVLQAVLGFFHEIPGIIGCFVSGSMATKKMDDDSDLDIGFLFQSDENREVVWQNRWEWPIAPWFHRFDADHIKPYFVIYLFEPQIKADINLYMENELYKSDLGPCTIVWDQNGVLETWIRSVLEQPNQSPDWQKVVHEDERFWAWLFYLYTHVNRGEYYHTASEFPTLRSVLETWTARISGLTHFTSRRFECTNLSELFLAYDMFPKPNRESLKASMLNAIQVQLALRKEIEDKLGITWKTEEQAIKRITELIDSL